MDADELGGSGSMVLPGIGSARAFVQSARTWKEEGWPIVAQLSGLVGEVICVAARTLNCMKLQYGVGFNMHPFMVKSW